MSVDTGTSSMANGRLAPKRRPMSPERSSDTLPVSLVHGLLDSVNSSLLVADRDGRVLLLNQRARQYLLSKGLDHQEALNLFKDILKIGSGHIFKLIENGEHRMELDVELGDVKSRALVKWMPDPDWLVVQLEIPTKEQNAAASEAATQLTVQELLQEREITYRNLLAAYLKLQEVNRQKTVFLASAAHELKTPLAGIKGYYDLLLTGSLGRLTDKQRDILEESKDSCERLVRLVSMFLNYSALESGKLVLQLRENDLRDCLEELSKRWTEAFQRKGVKLDAHFDPSIPSFRSHYQQQQQAEDKRPEHTG